MVGHIHAWFDITSPYSYFAWVYLRLNKDLLAFHGVQIHFHQLFIGAVVKGSKNVSPFEVPAKHAYNPVDIQRAAKYYDIPYSGFPSYMPASSAHPERCLYYIEEHYPDKHEAVWHALFEAFWARSLNVTKPENTEKVLREHFGGDEDAVRAIMAAAKQQKYKDALSADTKRAMDKGAFGAPWFWVRNQHGDEQPFWGSDRWQYMLAFLGVPAQPLTIKPKPSL